MDPGNAALATIGGARRTLVRRVASATTWRSMDDLVQHMGLGDASAVDAIIVRWPGGRLERFTVEGVNRTVELAEGAAEGSGR